MLANRTIIHRRQAQGSRALPVCTAPSMYQPLWTCPWHLAGGVAKTDGGFVTQGENL